MYVTQRNVKELQLIIQLPLIHYQYRMLKGFGNQNIEDIMQEGRINKMLY
jgi:hypothetical protein